MMNSSTTVYLIEDEAAVRKALARLVSAAGHGVHTAARRLGWETIGVVFLDIEQKDADRIMLSDDRLAALSELDHRRVADLLTDPIRHLTTTGTGRR